MKVLHITVNYPTKQHPILGIFVKEQVDSLIKQGIICDVFFINGTEKGIKEYVFAVFRLMKILMTKKYDVIHCHHTLSAYVYLLTGIGLFLSNKKIVSYQRPIDDEGGKFSFYLFRLFFDKIILKVKEPHYQSHKFVYLPNGVNMSFFTEIDKQYCKDKLHLEQNKDYIIIFISNGEKIDYKRYDRYKEVLNILKTKYNMESIEELVLTNTERELVPYYINAAKIHLLTSDIEGSPNSVKECLACNIPVVSTPVGNVREILSAVNGCYISSSFEPDALALLCKKAFENERIQGRNNLINIRLDMETTALKLIKLYAN